MDFFYTGPAGMWDAIVLAVACGLGLVFGGVPVKRLALLAVAMFLFDRTTMLMSGAWFAGAAIAGCVIATRLALPVSKGFAAFYILKTLAWTALVFGAIDFDVLATLATVFVYAQLFIILGGAADGPLDGKLSRGYRRAGAGLVRGLLSAAARLSGRASPFGHSEMPQQVVAAHSYAQEKNTAP